MNMSYPIRIVLVLAALLIATTTASAQTPLSSHFTYQGKLNLDGGPFNGLVDIVFKLYDAESSGNQVAPAPGFGGLPVVDGVFTVDLNYSTDAFNGDARWLEIDVRDADAGGVFTTLSPRQPITATPYALQTRGLFVDVAGNVEADGTVTAPRFVGDGSGLSGVSQLGSTVDLHDVAMMRWDLLNQKFPTGESPHAVAFDGANIWVTNRHGDNVTKLRASDGANLGTFPVGNFPVAACFDGANIWVASAADSNVMKLQASDGAVLDTFNTGGSPWALAFDGSNIWVVNLTGSVTKLRASDGADLGTFPVGDSPQGITFDGTHIWVANTNSDNVEKIRASDGASLGTVPVAGAPTALAFDGANIWVARKTDHSVTKLRASNGANLGTFPVSGTPSAVAFDGANIWVTDINVTKLRASDGANLGTMTIGNDTLGVAFDGSNIWVALSGEDRVMRISRAK
ncbi:MAG: hypothetical protein MI923_22840 [Phycisphaerales bacterium]|nr:hypothetical protein [Phycisphaerales bacterium]